MTTTILIAIAAFLAITLVLVALLLYAKAKLTSSGDVVKGNWQPHQSKYIVV